jgi:hypothetical protein
VAHEKELVSAGPGMEGELARRQREDQPAAACVDALEAENIPDEGARPLRILGVDDRVRARDQSGSSP